jgi:hypothetical protein
MSRATEKFGWMIVLGTLGRSGALCGGRKLKVALDDMWLYFIAFAITAVFSVPFTPRSCRGAARAPGSRS